MGTNFDLADAVGGFLGTRIEAIHGADDLLNGHGLLFDIEGNLLTIQHHVIHRIGYPSEGIGGFFSDFYPLFYGFGTLVCDHHCRVNGGLNIGNEGIDFFSNEDFLL